MKKIILAFSGGLDTSFCVPYLTQKGYHVITAVVNTGGFTDLQLQEIANKAKSLGAKKHYEIDAQGALYKQFATYLIKANYLKGGVYPACVGPERIMIAMEIAKIAKKEKVTDIAHGSTGAGNDQVRFDLAFKALIPNCNVIAPIRDESISRKDEVAMLKKNGVEVDTSTKDYSINIGLLGTTISGKETLTTDKELPEKSFPTVKPIKSVDDTPVEIMVQFEKGEPVSLQGEKLSGVEIINKLSAIGAAYGFGKDYHIGTTIVGLKGKVAFEAPAMKLLVKAHSELEKIVLTSKQLFWKNILGNLYGDLIHEGLYFDPLVKNIEAFLDSISQYTTGEVGLKIDHGTVTITSLASDYTLFNPQLGKYGEEADAWTGLEAKGFCKLYGLESVNAFLTHQS